MGGTGADTVLGGLMSDKKTVMLTLRVSENEQQMIKEAAAEKGLTVSKFLRMRIVGAV